MKAIKTDTAPFEQNSLLQLTRNQFEKMLNMVPELCKKISESTKPSELGERRDPSLLERDAIYREKIRHNMLEEYWWKLQLKQARKEEVIKAGIRKDKIIEILEEIFLKQFHLNSDLRKKYQKEQLLNKLLVQLDVEKKRNSSEELNKNQFNRWLLKKANENELLKEFFLQLQNRKKIVSFFDHHLKKEELAKNNNLKETSQLNTKLLNQHQDNVKKWNQKVTQLEEFTKEIINQELLNSLYNQRKKLLKHEKPVINKTDSKDHKNNENIPKSASTPLELKNVLDKIWKQLNLNEIILGKQYIKKKILHTRIQTLLNEHLDLKNMIKKRLLRKFDRLPAKIKDAWIKDKFQYQQKIVQLIEREIEKYIDQKIKLHTKQIASDFKKREKLIQFKLIHKHFIQFFHEILLDQEIQKKLDRIKKQELADDIKLDYKVLKKKIFETLWKEALFLKLLLKSRLEEISFDLDKNRKLINKYQKLSHQSKQYKKLKQKQFELQHKILKNQKQMQDSLSYVRLMIAQAKEAIRIQTQKKVNLQLPKVV